MSGAEVPDPGPEPLSPAAYQAAFTAIVDGRNRDAALVLRDLSPEALAELIVICGDVKTMAEAVQRRRGGQEGNPG